MPLRIDPSLIPDKPDLSFEESLWNAGHSLVVGIDEAGRGCLAGPVAASAVILPVSGDIPDDLAGIRDSKQLSAEQRDRERLRIENRALAWGVGWATNTEIDHYGILPATRLAAWRALSQLPINPEHLLVDYFVLPDIPLPQTRLVKGDNRSLSIAAASILAKTHRDTWMIENATSYPAYGFEKNKGYGTAFHREALQVHGPCKLHRLSFAPLRSPI